MHKRLFGFIVLSAFCFQLFGGALSAEAAAAPKLVITSPTPYQTISKGKTFIIKWNAANVGRLSLAYRNKATGISQLIGQNIDSAYIKQFSWVIPATLEDGEYDLYIEDQKTGLRHTIQVKLEGEDSEAPQFQRMITITSPNGGSFQYGEPISITWDQTGAGTTKFDVLVGAPNSLGQTSWSQIGTAVPGNWNQFTWVPNKTNITRYLDDNRIAPSKAKFKVMIVDPKDRAVKDMTDEGFTLQ